MSAGRGNLVRVTATAVGGQRTGIARAGRRRFTPEISLADFYAPGTTSHLCSRPAQVRAAAPLKLLDQAGSSPAMTHVAASSQLKILWRGAPDPGALRIPDLPGRNLGCGSRGEKRTSNPPLGRYHD